MTDEHTQMHENDSLIESFIPTDFTDVGQGTVLYEAYHHKLRYCEGVGWIAYNGGVWEPSETAAHSYSQRLTDLQMQEAKTMGLNNIGMFGQPASMSQTYMEYAVMRRSSAKIAAALREAKPKLSIRAAMLDGDPLILNTPDGEIHLDTGEMSPHEPEHFITHMTSCAPSDDGAVIWDTFLHQIACNDETLVAFLKQIAGMAAIGKVYEERLVIALGSGGNGKSTFFNAIQDVMGDYACTIRSELLVASNDSGKKFELARLRGKRLAIAEELEEGRQLDTAEVKHLCSTGDINAQFKGKDVFTFKPSHSIVLCTNHMPSVKVMDSGTWDRLIVVPFRGRFRSQENEFKTMAITSCEPAAARS